MSLSKYGSTEETTNLARLARIILGPCTDVLRDVLKKKMSEKNPSDLPGNVKTFITHLPKFRKSPFTKQQEKIVYTGKYSDFDITLLYILFRNICTFLPHSNQWGNVPDLRDRSESANIERIRLLRNKYQGHHSSISISSSDFNQEWQDIFDIVKELEMYLGTCTVYQEEVKKLTSCCMDPEQETKYIKQLLDFNKKLDDISELIDREVSRWKEDDKVFLETHNFPAMFNKVIEQSYVTFVGVPGSGKSVTARHIALKLQERGYDILPIKDISGIETHCNLKLPQVFVIDDVVGVWCLDLSLFNKLCQYKSTIENPEVKETKILMTCREVVYRNEYLKNTFLSKNNKVVQLHSDENSLTDQDKYNLLAIYNLNKPFISSIDLSSASKMFPFLCKLYSNTSVFKNYGPHFFISPYSVILTEMNEIKKQNKIQYASLVLLMVNDGKLSETTLDDDFDSKRKQKKSSVLKSCKVKYQTDSFSFIEALSEMEGTYTKKCKNDFTFIHDSIFEIVACHFGRQFPELMLKYMSSDYIAHYIKVEKNQSGKIIGANVESSELKASSLCTILSESHYQKLAKRLLTDVENGEILVFENEALKHPSVRQAFIGVMKGKSYRELYSIFLSELKEEIKDSFPWSKTENEYEIEFWERTCLLLNRRNCRKSVRAISWVIYHGHHHILRYLIDQILWENEIIDDLFQNSYNKDVTGSDKDRVVYDTVDDIRGSVMTASDSDIESDIDLYSEKVTVEQFRLLCLGCLSADQTTVQILLKHIDIKILKNTVNYLQITNFEIDPLVYVCKYGFTNIAVELLQAGANFNLFGDLSSPILAACDNGHTGVVKELIKAGADINSRYETKTPLTAACSKGHLNVVKQLINVGVDVNLRDEYKTPLTAACKAGHIDVVVELIKAGADINLVDKKKTPLMTAFDKRHSDIVELLVEAGSEAIPKDGHKTSLTIACLKGQLEEVEKIIQAGVDVNLRDGILTPLVAACYMGHVRVVKKMIKAGTSVNLLDGDKTPLTVACLEGHSNVADELINAGACVNLKDKHSTPLITACYNGHLKVTEFLIKAGANVDLDDGEKTPLTAACLRGHLRLVDLLIEVGVNINLKDSKGTPLSAAYKGGTCIFKKLIEAGADFILGNGAETSLITACKGNNMFTARHLIDEGFVVNFQTFDQTALLAACFEGHLIVVNSLIKYGADVNLTGKNGLYTPLRAACEKNNLEIITVLIRAGADVNLVGKCGEYTPLITACFVGNLDVTSVLINAGADVNLRSNDRDYTPLIAACMNNHLNLVDALIKSGADVNITGRTNTPLTAACQGGHLKVVDALLKCGANVNLAGESGGYTPLLAASRGEHLEVFDLLIEAGANRILFD